MLKTGFVGGGNMAGAMIGGMMKSGVFTPGEIVVSDASTKALEALREKFAVDTTPCNREAVSEAELVVLTVKPQVYGKVLDEIKDLVDETKIVMTVAPGWTLERTQAALGKPCKMVRAMPNTPALVGEGMTAVCPNERVTPAEMEQVLAMSSSFGRVEVLPESQFDAFVALCGSSPAFVFMMIEAMADAAVWEGLPRAQAYSLASQAVLGSARMVLELGKHPAELKDMVCSPGGTTIEGVRALEEKGLRAAVMEALRRTADKARSL